MVRLFGAEGPARAMTVYFVSGHLDLTQEEFDQHYVPALYQALGEGSLSAFLLADAKGADSLAQFFLAGRLSDVDRVRVTVYHMFEKPRYNAGPFPTRGGFIGDTDRDRAMTMASNKDIAWVRAGRENSGTAKNIKRRAKSK